MSTNLCSTILFGLRNTDKTGKGDIGRLPVAAGQFYNAAHEIGRLNGQVGQSVSAFSSSSQFLSGAKKCAEFAGKHINPLICVAGGIKVATAKDKDKEFVNQVCALGTMFAAEKAYKALTDYQTVKDTVKKVGIEDGVERAIKSNFVKNINTKLGDRNVRIALNVLKGLGLFATSISAYSLGEKIAKHATNDKKLKKTKQEYNDLQRALHTPQKNVQVG